MSFLDKWAGEAQVRSVDWTPDEVDRLRVGIADGQNDSQLAIMLGRSRRAVGHKRIEIVGVRYKNFGERGGAWTTEREDLLKQLAAEGWSNGQIALKMGLSRNAIVGKRYRLGLPKREPGRNLDAKCLPHKPRRDGRPTPQGYRSRAIKAKVIPIGIVEPLRIGFMELKRNHCRFVIDEKGDDGLAVFCGHPKLGPHSYCAGHWQKTIDRRPRGSRFALLR